MPTYKIHPEFNGLEEFVWEYLKQAGSSIPHIEEATNRTLQGGRNAGDPQHHIWHNKARLDEFVAKRLQIQIANYGQDKSKNAFYKATANAIRMLRKEKLLIDWRQKNGRGTGVWRLDERVVESWTSPSKQLASAALKQIQRQQDFSSYGSEKNVFVRAKQSAFRKILLSEYERCVFCKFKLEPYMIGAHIVPYSMMRRMDPKNSMNPTNGLLLCRLCDVAFEKGSIQVQKDLGITVTDYLQDQKDTTIKSWIGNIATVIPVKKDASYPPDPKYLKMKRDYLRTRL